MNLGSSLGIEPKIGRCGGSSSSVRYDFAEGIGKIARNTPGDRQRKTMRLASREAEGFSLHPKKIDSGRRCASRKRTRE
ncbi:hypothetical protein GW17_00029339 [Ensete ventricosum]|nr:hypothetical protein GW17_00029339 [Ensete ventricosum]